MGGGNQGGVGTHLGDLLVVQVVPCLCEGLHRVARADYNDDERHAEECWVLAQYAVHGVALERV